MELKNSRFIKDFQHFLTFCELKHERFKVKNTFALQQKIKKNRGDNFLKN